MTPSARLSASIDLLAAMEAAPRKPADAIANSFFRERRYIGGGDRRAISALVWDVMRGWRRLGWWLEQQGQRPTPRLLAGAQLLFDGMSVQDVAFLYVGGRFAAGKPRPAEQAALAALDGQELVSPAMPRAVVLAVPEWLPARLEDTFGMDV